MSFEHLERGGGQDGPESFKAAGRSCQQIFLFSLHLNKTVGNRLIATLLSCSHSHLEAEIVSRVTVAGILVVRLHICKKPHFPRFDLGTTKCQPNMAL